MFPGQQGRLFVHFDFLERCHTSQYVKFCQIAQIGFAIPDVAHHRVSQDDPQNKRRRLIVPGIHGVLLPLSLLLR